MILFIQNFDIIPGKEDEYPSFISKTYLPGIDALGLPAIGGYYVEVGFGPMIVAVLTCRDVATCFSIASGKAFKEYTVGLKSLVYNYRSYLLEPLGKVKREAYTIQKGIWKFAQYYDLRAGKKKEYADFVVNQYLPVMEQLDFMEVTGGWNMVLGGANEIMAEFTFTDPVDVGRLLNNDDFRRLTFQLKTDYVVNYSSRILRCTERFDEPRWFRL